MIITCVNCNKKFNVNSDLIPEDGRTIQCGSCNHIWFFKKNFNDLQKDLSDNTIKKTRSAENKKSLDIKIPQQTDIQHNKIDKITKKKRSEIVKYQPKKKFTFVSLLSYIIVSLISFVALIILLDTFKSPLYNNFPQLELILFNFFETLKDIQLFIKDLI